MATSTAREQARRKAKVRKAAMTLNPEAATQLWPTNGHAIALIETAYDALAEQCQCKTRQHRRKDCQLRGQKKCGLCGTAYPDRGEYPDRCEGCAEWEEERILYLGEWALAHDDRPDQQQSPQQFALFAGDVYDFDCTPKPAWPFLWSRPRPIALETGGACTICGDDSAPTSQQWETDSSTTTRPVCTPCIRLGNLNKTFTEGPVTSIEQLKEIIAGRNDWEVDISERREPWRKETEAELNERIERRLRGAQDGHRDVAQR